MGRVTQLIAIFLLALLIDLSTSATIVEDRQFPTYRISRHLHQTAQSTSNEGTPSSQVSPMSMTPSDPTELGVEDLEELVNVARRVKRQGFIFRPNPSRGCKPLEFIINLLKRPFNIEAVKYLKNQNEFQPNSVTVLDLLVRYGLYDGNSEYPGARRDSPSNVYGKKNHVYHVASPSYPKKNHTYQDYRVTSPPYPKKNHTYQEYRATSPPYQDYRVTSPPHPKKNHTFQEYRATIPPYQEQETYYEAPKPTKDYGGTANEYTKGSYVEEDGEEEEEEEYERRRRQSDTYEAPAPLNLDYFDQEDLLFLYNLNEFAENSKYVFEHLVFILNFLQDLIDTTTSNGGNNNNNGNNGGNNNNGNNGGNNNNGNNGGNNGNNGGGNNNGGNGGRRKREIRPKAKGRAGEEIEDGEGFEVPFLSTGKGPLSFIRGAVSLI